MNLRIPGPTPVPPAVLEASARQMIDHRGPEFAALLERVTARLKAIFLTEGDVLLLTASGTGGMEAAIVNTLSPGDEVLAITVGAFGDRFAEIAEAYGLTVHRLAFEWGTAVDPERVRQALEEHPGTKAVLVTHNESSTGVTNDVQAVAALAREHDALTLVDSVSGAGALELPVDAWGLDVVVTASQKAWMAQPGLAMVTVSARAWDAYQRAKLPRFYWDFGQALRYLKRGQTPATPAVSVLYALDASLELMLREGLEELILRHQRVAQRLRDGLRALGLELLPEERYASNTVTAVKAPEGLDVAELRRRCREEHGLVIAGGQGKLERKVFRIGHMGWVTDQDIDAVLEVLGKVLPQLLPARAR
jgi:aspartate aminotransferase-like enzyme